MLRGEITNGKRKSHPKGRPRLRNALAASYAPEFDRKLNPETEILVTAGANEGEGVTRFSLHDQIALKSAINAASHVCDICWIFERW